MKIHTAKTKSSEKRASMKNAPRQRMRKWCLSQYISQNRSPPFPSCPQPHPLTRPGEIDVFRLLGTISGCPALHKAPLPGQSSAPQQGSSALTREGGGEPFCVMPCAQKPHPEAPTPRRRIIVLSTIGWLRKIKTQSVVREPIHFSKPPPPSQAKVRRNNENPHRENEI